MYLQANSGRGPILYCALSINKLVNLPPSISGSSIQTRFYQLYASMQWRTLSFWMLFIKPISLIKSFWSFSPLLLDIFNATYLLSDILLTRKTSPKAPESSSVPGTGCVYDYDGSSFLTILSIRSRCSSISFCVYRALGLSAKEPISTFRQVNGWDR